MTDTMVARDQLRSIVERIFNDVSEWRDVSSDMGALQIVWRSAKNCLGVSVRDTNRAFMLASVHLGWPYALTKAVIQKLVADVVFKTNVPPVWQEKDGFVYFAGYPEKTDEGDFRFVKIGFSKNPPKRLNQLRRGNLGQSLELINVFPALMIHEHELHMHLRNFHSAGEIFRVPDEIYNEISSWEIGV